MPGCVLLAHRAIRGTYDALLTKLSVHAPVFTSDDVQVGRLLGRLLVASCGVC